MKIPVIRLPIYINIGIIIVTLFVGFITFLIGSAHLVEAMSNPQDYNMNTEHIVGVIFCIVLCIIGIFCFLVAIASAKGIREKMSKKNI